MHKPVFTCLMLALLVSASVPAPAMMPVVDVAAIRQLVEQITTAQKQLTTLRDQLTQARQVYDALTGSRGMERLVSGTARNYLPPDWSALLSTVDHASGSYATLARDLEAIKRANARLLPEQLAVLTDDQRQVVEDARRATALMQAISREGLKNTSARFSAIQQLIDAIPTARDPKAIQELQARIAAEQGMLVNEATKLQSLYQTAQAESVALELRIQEETVASFGSMRDLPPMGL